MDPEYTEFVLINIILNLYLALIIDNQILFFYPT